MGMTTTERKRHGATKFDALELSIAMAALALRFEPRGSGAAPPSSGSLRAGLHTVLASRYLLMICAFCNTC